MMLRGLERLAPLWRPFAAGCVTAFLLATYRLVFGRWLTPAEAVLVVAILGIAAYFVAPPAPPPQG